MRVAGWSAAAAAGAGAARRGDRGAGPRLRRRGAAGLGAAGRPHRRRSPTRWSRPAPRCAPRPSSAATRPAIGSRPKAPGRSRPAGDPAPERGNVQLTASAAASRRARYRGLCAGQEQRRPASRKVFKLSSNETPLGPSPKAIAAYKAVAEHLRGLSGRRRDRAARGDRPRLRARPRPHRLRRRLRRPAQSARATPISRDGDEAIHTTHGFLVYPIATLGSGAKPVVAPENELHRRCRRDPRAR